MREITAEEIETYERDGVVHLPGIVDEEWVERIQTALDRILDHPRTAGHGHERTRRGPVRLGHVHVDARSGFPGAGVRIAVGRDGGQGHAVAGGALAVGLHHP